MKNLIVALIVVFSYSLTAQTVVPVGSGSYASYPLASEGTNVTDFSNLAVNVPVGNTKPIPTNDWWTEVLIKPIAGNLWAYPIVIKPQTYGAQLFFPVKWANQDMVKDYPLAIKGTGFNPPTNIAKNWNDWGVTVNMQDAAKYMDITIGNGFPMAWFEISGFDPYIEFGNGVTFFKSDGSPVAFPYTSNNFGALYQGKYYGIYAPDNTLFTLAGTTITMKNPATKTYFTVATLMGKTDLAYFNTFAYSIPRDTKVSWNYQPEKAIIDVTWTITTDNLKGAAEKRVIQGFLPHHYKNCKQGFNFNNQTYATPRGLLKCAEGNVFKFSYAFNGVLAHTPAPMVQAVPNPYDPAKMKTMIDAYSTTTGYGADTYWGGKDVLNYAKYALIAKETGNANYASILQKSRNSLLDWFTYTPGETEHYFARYDKWKALIGFNSSYGSEQFTDNHFHYGYHIYASALLGMVDQDFLTKYGPMAKLVVKQYANWDRTDTDFPFFRTFSPWKGHSYAGGTSSDDGNNQESSSEAMQSWAGMFLLGDILGDTAMRAAGAFGYLSESRAIREYWLDVDKQNLPSTYPHTMVGIVFDGGVNYGTWFSGDPIHIHAIQWIPWAPIMNHLAQYPAYLKSDYAIMKADQTAKYPAQTDESDYGADWANVALSYEQMYDPAYTASRFDEYWAAAVGTPKNNVTKDVTAGQTYYYMHAHRTLGDIQWNYHTSAPNSQVYYNASANTYCYVGYNALATNANITIYKDSVPQGSINVAAKSFFKVCANANTTGITENALTEEPVTIYPNPFTNTVSIQALNLTDQFKSIDVYNGIGELVESVNVQGREKLVTIGDKYTPGVYFVKVIGNFGFRSYRLIKM